MDTETSQDTFLPLQGQRIKDAEESLCRQFLYILGVFEILSRVKVTPGQSSESLFKNLHKVYNFASSLVKYFRKNSTKLKPAFESTKLIPVIQGAGTVLKQAVTELILHVEGSQHGGKSKDTNIQKNKILKEIMVIPSVVQAIDMFDKEIALLAKKTNIDVLKYTKYGAIRDFRIQNYQLKENLDKLNSSLLITQVQPGDNDAVEVNNYDSISE